MNRAPLLVAASSSTAPTTTTRTFAACAAADPNRAAPATNVASGPFASTLPRPYSTAFSLPSAPSAASMRTGMLPGTVSMWPSRTIVRDADGSPSSPTALPASSTKARSKPAARIWSTSHVDAAASCRDSDGIATSPAPVRLPRRDPSQALSRRSPSDEGGSSLIALAIACTPMSISFSLITSGGSRRSTVGPAGSAITP